MEARTRFLADWVFAMRAVIIREMPQLQWHPMSSERRRIASAATLILVAYGLSRVLGAVRELVIANTFGTGHQIDDYRVAFGVPDLLFNLLLAGAIIVAAAFFAPRYGVTALAIGVVAGAMLHVGVQLPALWRTGWRPTTALGLDDPGVRKVGRLMFPIALGLAAAQVNVFVDTILGTSLPHGRVAALRYADTMAQLPLGTFSQALAFVLFPFLARDAALGAIDSIRHRTSLALRLNIFVLVPASVGLALLGVPITAALFERGQFGPESVRQTAFALTFFSLGLAGQAATALLVRVFYALQDVITPLRISLVVIGVNLATNIVLVNLLAQGGLALGTSIAATLNAVLLARALRGRLGGLEGAQIFRTTRRAVVGVVPMAAIAAGVAFLITGGSLQGGLRPLVAIVVAVALAALTYLGVEVLLRSEEVGLVLSVIRRDRSRV
ncbi:MAG: hypothetical protein E6I37_05220 [Chloroflexi bacterium]|nr:MAG: hypothetical protein E6I37_05220 [Chloroflexota bacterium]